MNKFYIFIVYVYIQIIYESCICIINIMLEITMTRKSGKHLHAT